MGQKVNQENILVIYQYGHKILFDGYLIIRTKLLQILLNINHILFEGYLTTTNLYQLATSNRINGEGQ